MQIAIKEDTTLLNFVLSYFPQVSLTKAKKMILYNCFSLSGASVKSFEYMLHKGDTITYEKYSGGRHIAREKRDISVIYEDEDIIIVNKSAGRSVTDDKEETSLFNLTKSYLKRKYHRNELFVVFAPQKDESGLCLMAKSKLARNWLEKQKDSFVLHVAAIITGSPVHKNDKRRFFVQQKNGIFSLCKEGDTHAKAVFLQYKTVEDYSMGENDCFHIDIVQSGCTPYLNRFLLSQMNNPVYGDNVFNERKDNRRMLRYCIYGLDFLRPSTNRKIRIETSLPKNFASLNIPVEKIL